ncbi:MAG: 30S ribosomal protein S3 [Patescibacteria group bacterium]
MGQKVNPKSFRIGVTRTWTSRWFSQKQYAKFLEQDVRIKKHIKRTYKDAGIDRIEIERSPGKVNVIIHTAKPGLIIGRGGQAIEALRKEVSMKFIKDRTLDINISIQEIKQPNLSAEVVMQGMIMEIEKRVPFRRVLKRSIENVMRAGAQGVKVSVAGRLNGAEIARTEMLSEGKVPLHTLRANIDYARGMARTTYGAIGIKVWIYRGEVFTDNMKADTEKRGPRKPRKRVTKK